MNVSLQQLKVFVAVARSRSFTRAAREFGLTQSAVSRCVRELEEAVDLKLFDRTTRQVELTSAGSGFERRIARLLDEIDMALSEGRDTHQAHRGVVTMASNPALSSAWVPHAMARCAAALPAVTLHLQDWSQEAVLQAVEQGEVDFGVIAEVMPALRLAGGQFDVQPIAATPLCALLPAQHSLGRVTPLHWSALADEALVTLNRDSGFPGAVVHALAGLRAPDHAMREFAQAAGVARMVQLGMGIGILPVSTGADDGDARHWPLAAGPHVVRVLHPVVEVSTLLVRRRHRSLRPCALAVWSQFIEAGRIDRAAAQEPEIVDSIAQ
ncbi:DNA-binding transcriptional LysR family regulator [Paraburkholderia bannensis]|uniref:DNA-binding transcriptional LysR family regulator n=1 Tax=Paraburkholderia bannensis TaxID=765414 RepID=A0A7W9U128_9BURK|nr:MULTISPECIES: LysR family transcriptional regulator [Paraburkholderia]MBB3260266.1 DNA-binding transcriptional LysR family regulator [Paraburkholderia sp. WP4_3_2]MBB6105078.1 DNA-binding transcriptional LysR family regulator [Paraburkholderia bannensis]